MFHLFNKVYVAYDFTWTDQYDFIMASDTLALDAAFAEGVDSPINHSADLDSLLEEHFDGDISNLWQKLYDHNGKIIVYLKQKDLVKMLAQFYKHVLETPSADAAYILYKTRVESLLLSKNFLSNINKRVISLFRQLSVLSKNDFDEIYATCEDIAVLDQIPIETLGFELLLVDYMIDNNSKYANTLLNRVSNISWENWISELEELKMELLSGILDSHRLNDLVDAGKLNIPEIDVNQSLITQIKTIPELQWILDPDWNHANPTYIKNNYNPELFSNLYDAIYKVWDSGEDMREICHAIVADDPKTLLDRDVARKHSCIFTVGKFRSKMNFVFCNYVYNRVNSNKTDELNKFKLR